MQGAAQRWSLLTMLWRQVPSVRELCRLLNREDLQGMPSGQGVSTSPIQEIFRVWLGLNNALPRILVVDGSTLEALFRKLKSLQEKPITKRGMTNPGLTHYLYIW